MTTTEACVIHGQRDLRVEMEASNDPSASSCIVAALSGTVAPKASAGASVSVVVSVD